MPKQMNNVLNNQQDKFIKYHGIHVLRDWKRVNLLFLHAYKTEGVYAPKPLFIDLHNQTITYEFIHAIKPIINVLNTDINKASTIGYFLAEFHHTAQVEIDLSSQQQFLHRFDLTQKEIDFAIDKLPCAFFIGDAWHGNMFFDQNNNIILLDPIPNHYFFPSHFPDYTSSLLDVSTLYMSFFVCHPLLDYTLLNKKHIYNIATKVIEAYVDYFGDSRLLPLIRKVSKHIALIHARGYKNRIMWPVGQIKSIYACNILKMM